MGENNWWRGATLYQIYPRSFMDANSDGIGDLKGVIEKLGYVAELGVDGIWLSPFFRSPMRDFGYDVSDYRDVDPIFGTLADFDALLARAKALGLRVIIDQVWSHSSDRHVWFERSATDSINPYADYYVWADAKPDGSPPNNWQAVFGGPSWTWHPRRRQYYLHNFLSSQPDLNFWNPAVRQEILDIARFWLDRGVDGFRLDVINLAFHDARLRDNPSHGLTRAPNMASLFQHHRRDRSQHETLAFVEELRRLMDRYDARMCVGEVFDEDALNTQKRYIAGENRLHTAYSFFLLDAQRLTPALFQKALNGWEDGAGWPSWSLGNHDVMRFPSRLQAPSDGVRAALCALMAMRGCIFLYQGDELGLPQADVPRDRLRDPFAIAAYTGSAFRDGARTPMPWNGELRHAGFSSAEDTWLPVDPRHRPLCVHRQCQDDTSMLAFTRRLIAVRQSHSALRSGACAVLPAPDGVLAITRTMGDQAIACLVNTTDAVVCVTSHHQLGAPIFTHAAVAQDGRAVTLGPYAAAYFAIA